ncbi:MAG: hypothetical protein IJ493_03085 [Clostridia bacterium]|nr:hypothetical protein [Clostridia bacterium]
MSLQTGSEETCITFDVPVLSDGSESPASVYRVSLVRRDGANIMRIIIRRDLSIPIESFTFRYRFSTLPVYAADPAHVFHSYVYSENDLNNTGDIVFNGQIPAGLKISGCSAYVSEVKLIDGTIMTFEPTQFRILRRAARPVPAATAAAPVSVKPAAPVPAKPATAVKPAEKPVSAAADAALKKKDNRKRTRLAVILTLLFFFIILEVLGGIWLVRYTGVSNSVDKLLTENCYNEAYKIASDAEYSNLLQRVCEKASVYYFSEGDLESAYVYAYGAPSPFTEMIVDYAVQSVVSTIDGEINENAFRVAKMATDNDKFDGIVHSMCDMLIRSGDYSNAIRVVNELRDSSDREASRDEIFREAIAYYIDANRFEELIAYVNDLSGVNGFSMTADEVSAEVISACISSNNNAAAVYFASLYGKPTDGYVIAADDAGVRARLEEIYPLLSADQKRAYHARTLTIYRELLTIKGGRLIGSDINNAVSLDSNADTVVVLRDDGSVALLNDSLQPLETQPTVSGVVQVAAGGNHIVYLKGDGSVAAGGDNTYGQCDVSDWSNIVRVTAGSGFTVGLRADGTLVAAGSNVCGQCDVSGYRNVVDIAAGRLFTVILFSDGTTRIQGFNSYGLHDVSGLTKVKRIRAGSMGVLVHTTDGAYTLYEGLVNGTCGNPYNWRSISDFDVGELCIAATEASGVTYIDGDGLLPE